MLKTVFGKLKITQSSTQEINKNFFVYILKRYKFLIAVNRIFYYLWRSIKWCSMYMCVYVLN